MKKLYYILFFSISFLFLNSVNAKSLEVDYSSSSNVENYLSAEQIQQAEQMRLYLENNSYWSDFDYVIRISRLADTNDNYIRVNLFNKVSNNNKPIILYPFIRSGYTSGLTFRVVDDYSVNGVYSSFSNYNYNYMTGTSNPYLTPSDIMQYENNSQYPASNTGKISMAEARIRVDDTSSTPTLYSTYSANYLIYYSSFDLYTGTVSSDISYTFDDFHFLNTATDFDETESLGARFYTYYDTLTPTSLVNVNKVNQFDDGSYGIYQDMLNIFNYNLNIGSNYTNYISCVQPTLNDTDKSFINDYCVYTFSDFPENYDIPDYLESGFHFSFPYGNSPYQILSENGVGFYAINFRLLKPYTPKIFNVVVNTAEFSNDYDIYKIYHYDRGSYIDYVVVLNITDVGTSSNVLNNIDIFLSAPINNDVLNIDTFNLSVYRSYKLKYFSSAPSATELENFVVNNDLSTINNTNNLTSFFTDNTFDTYGFSGIITMPFRFLYAMSSADTCSDIDLPFPNSNKTLKLKCISSTIPDSLSPLINILRIILNGIVCYYIGVNTFRTIKELLEPNNANIEVVDL